MKQNMTSYTAVWLEVVPVFMVNTRGIQVLFALLKTINNLLFKEFVKSKMNCKMY